ncbi:extracellular solute-binding protein [Paenibacillus sabuli]|nr:extracellular solute-binding protein [Paenibacillus sabuli]
MRKLAISLSLLLLVLLTASLGREQARGPVAVREEARVEIVINDLGLTFPDGMDENTNPYIAYVREETELDVRVELPPSEVYEEKLNAIMASGKLPDLIHTYNPVWVDEYVDRGKLLPLDYLLATYGQELLRRIPEEAWARVRYEGEIYAIPSLMEVQGTELMYARKDWLDRLGLGPPVTLDDYYEVIRAFAEDDPDGNGKDDTIGLLLTEDLGRSAPLLGAFGVQRGIWLERGGELVYGSTLPEMKEGLAFLARLYREGLLDPLFPLNRNGNLIDKIAGGQVGLYSAAWYDTRGPIAQSMRNDPEAEWIALDYPVGPSGTYGVYGNNLIRGFNVTPVGAEHPERVVQLLNFIAGDGAKALKLGFEGEIWTMEDGRMVTDFPEHDKHLYRGMYQALVDIPDPLLDKRRLDSLGEQFRLYDNQQRIAHNLIPDRFYGTPTPAMSGHMTRLRELEEVFTRIVVGVDPPEAFDDFVAQWYAEGGEQITREVNAWYDAQREEDGSS